jgi:hypothetical protein
MVQNFIEKLVVVAEELLQKSMVQNFMKKLVVKEDVLVGMRVKKKAMAEAATMAA